MRKQPRKTITLLRLMKRNMPLLRTGLCGLVKILFYCEKKITIEEYRILNDYLDSNAPDELDMFDKVGYWWETKDSTPRIAWLNTEIEKLKNAK